MMRRVSSLSIGQGGMDMVRQGQLAVPEGRGVAGIELHIQVPVTNATGAPITLSVNDRLAILAMFVFSLRYGANLAHRPFRALNGQIMRILQRIALGIDVGGFTDATTGLATPVPATSTSTLLFRIAIPTGRLYFLGNNKDTGAMGRSQARTVELEVRRNANPTLTAGLSIGSAAAVVDVYPIECAKRYDQIAYIPAYDERNDTGLYSEFPDGMPLGIFERTAPSLTSTLGALILTIGGSEIIRDVTPLQLVRRLSAESPLFLSGADISDVVTPIYEIPPDTDFKDLLTGPVRIDQPSRQLANMQWSYYGLPIVAQPQRSADLEWISSNVRRVPLKGVTLPIVNQKQVPSRVLSFVPTVLMDETNSSWRFPGLAVAPGGKAQPVVPPTALSAARAAASAGPDAAVQAAKSLAAAIPGGVASGRGFEGDQTGLQSVAPLIA